MMYEWDKLTFRLREATTFEPPSDGYPTILGKTAADRIEELEATIQSLQQENARLMARDKSWGICTDCGSCRYYPPQGDSDE